ncbi:hypothetical protein [Marivirga tractuosa]|uniref:hypothetical protein n=1 Tax=Marivirga tractuosa TaxID=1006 RepID=UPI0011D26F86|nr:hypothetical protein [Marivirga tractuosa]
MKKSFILKSGSILYNLKDIIIVQFFESRPGLYSIYAFSLKFATALNLIANAPIMNIFITKVNNLVSEKSERKKYFSLYKSVLSQTLTLYIIGFLATYFLLPYLLKLDMIDVDINNIAVVKRYFLLLSLFYLVVIMFFPIQHFLIAFRDFRAVLISHVSFILIFMVLYFFAKSPESILFNMIFAQIVLCIINLFFANKKLQNL